MCMQPGLKKLIFVNLTLFLDLKKQAQSYKNNSIFWKYVQNKFNVGEDAFLDLTEISS